MHKRTLEVVLWCVSLRGVVATTFQKEPAAGQPVAGIFFTTSKPNLRQKPQQAR